MALFVFLPCWVLVEERGLLEHVLGRAVIVGTQSCLVYPRACISARVQDFQQQMFDFLPSLVLLSIVAAPQRTLFSPEMSEFYEARLMEAGVSIEKNVTAERLWGLEEQVMCT